MNNFVEGPSTKIDPAFIPVMILFLFLAVLDGLAIDLPIQHGGGSDQWRRGSGVQRIESACSQPIIRFTT